MLTLKKLKAMKPNTIFAKGYGFIEHPWFNDAKRNLEKNGRSVKVKWIAIRGGTHDWAIYHSLDANLEPANYLDGNKHLEVSDDAIAKLGAKLHREDEIKKLIPCSKLAFKMYRH